MRNLQILLVKCTESDFSEIAEVISNIMKSSRLGYKLFHFLYDKVVSESLAIFVRSAVDELGSKAMTAKWMTTTTQKGMAEVKRLDCQQHMETQRDIAVEYRRVAVRVRCSSAAEELRLVRHDEMKSGKKLMDALKS